MNLDEITLLLDYNDWADRRIFAAGSRVTLEQFLAPSACGTGRGGLRPTLVHLVDNLWQWRITLQGYYAKPLSSEADYDATELREVDFPTFTDVEARWQIERQALRAQVDTLTDEALNGIIRYVIPGAVRERVIWQLLFDVVNHAGQHRAEAAVLLTTFGQSPGDLDFTLFQNERASSTP